MLTMTATELANSIIKQVREMISDGIVPESCKSFAALHDCCDANVLGDQERLYDALMKHHNPTGEDEAGHQKALDAHYNVSEPAQNIVDQWLKTQKCGRPVVRKGEVVTIKPEWQDKGDDKHTFRATEDDDGRSVVIVCETTGMNIWPTQTVRLEMLVLPCE